VTDKWDVLAVEDQFIRYEKDGWVVECSWPVRGKADEVKVEMEVTFLGIDGGLVMARRRVNIRSGSQTGAVLTMINRLLADQPAKNKMQMDFQKVLKNVNEWYEQGKEVERPDPNEVKAHVDWLLYPIWPAEGITGVAAAPGSMKSYVAQTIALSLNYDTPLLQRNTKTMGEKRILFLDWEDYPDTFARRLRALQKANGLKTEAVLDYKRMTVSMNDASSSVAEVVRQGEYDGLVVDSMSASISGGMNDDEAVNAFWSGIHRVGVPALVLAHKSVANINNRTARFFGSGMSEARVRMGWNAEATESREFVVWECFKDNSHGKLGAKLAWQVEFEEKGSDEKAKINRVSFLGVNPDSVLFETEDSGRKEITRNEEVARLITIEGPMTRAEIADRLHSTEDAIRKAMGRGTHEFTRLDSGQWSL